MNESKKRHYKKKKKVEDVSKRTRKETSRIHPRRRNEEKEQQSKILEQLQMLQNAHIKFKNEKKVQGVKEGVEKKVHEVNRGV